MNQLVALDCGNANIKIASGERWVSFAHALKHINDAELEDYSARDELAKNPDIFKVNGEYFMIGERAIRKGAGEVLYGENRYTPEYYGILASIAMFKFFDKSELNIFLIGEMTPKDIVYRQVLIDSVILSKRGVWHVESMGIKKQFGFKNVKGYDEPVGIFRYATLRPDGGTQSGWLKSGRCCVIDLGGFTTGFSILNNGYVDYGASESLELGMLDLEDELAKMLKKAHKTLLRGSQWLEPLGLRYALANPGEGYNAHGAGYIPCTEEVDTIFSGFTRRLHAHFQGLGGITKFDTILLGGGGTGTAEKRIRKVLKHPHTYLAESNLEIIHAASAMGAWKAASILLEAGKLK